MTVNIQNAMKIEGFMYSSELQWLAECASTHNHIVEIGSWLGRSTRALADNTSGTVTAVDTWTGMDTTFNEGQAYGSYLVDKPKDWLLNEFKRNISGLNNIRIVRMTSLEAAVTLKEMSFDMIFIDGSHNYEAVRADILAWHPLLAEGGLLCGHDYEGQFPGLVRAVRELLPEAHLVGSKTKEPGEEGFSLWMA
jgi:Methyltransferase domain